MASISEISEQRTFDRASQRPRPACPHCGDSMCREDEAVTKRGAIVIAHDPLVVFWRNRAVPLSPIEAQIYAHICRRGRVTYDEIGKVMEQIGASPATRSLVLGHIRRKFLNMGACDPFERLGTDMLRLRVDPDESGHTAPVIGMKLPRYATAR